MMGFTKPGIMCGVPFYRRAYLGIKDHSRYWSESGKTRIPTARRLPYSESPWLASQAGDVS